MPLEINNLEKNSEIDFFCDKVLIILSSIFFSFHALLDNDLLDITNINYHESAIV